MKHSLTQSKAGSNNIAANDHSIYYYNIEYRVYKESDEFKGR